MIQLADVLLSLVNPLFKTVIVGREHLSITEPSIIIPNHTSLVDAVILLQNLPKDDVYFVSNTDIAKKYTRIFKGRNIITVDPLNPYAVRDMVKMLKNGKSLVIFPEGRITLTGGLMKIYQGVGYIAIKTGAKLIPVTIDGLDRSEFSYLNHLNKTVPFPKVKLLIDQPFTIPKMENIPIKKQKEKATDAILHVLQNGRFQIQQKNNINLFNELLTATKKHGSTLRISEDLSGVATYKNLLLNTYVLSEKLVKLVDKDRRVGLLMPNSNAHVVLLFSLFRIGKTPAILNFSAGSQTLLTCCETADIKTVITSKMFIEKGGFEPLVNALKKKKVRILFLDKKEETIVTEWNPETDTESLFRISFSDKKAGFTAYFQKKKSTYQENELILFTSGSESAPKGVVLTHENIYSNIYQARSIIDFTSKDKIMNALPMFHSFGLTAGTLLPLLLGVQTFLYPSPLHYRVIPEIAYDRNATILFGTSTFLSGYGRFAHPYDFFSIRYVFAGAERLKPEVSDLWFQKFGIRIFEGYGITETSPILSLNTPLAYKKTTVGRFLPGIEYKITSVEGIENGGNLFVKGPNVMKGYLLHQTGFAACGEWYDTGDVVEVDEDGFIKIVSRLKRFAKIGGEMISLNLVEQIASECFIHEGFSAVSLQDGRKGEKILLYTTKNAQEKETLRHFIQEKGYSPLMVPSQLLFIKDLPLLGSGKTDYVRLKQFAEIGRNSQ